LAAPSTLPQARAALDAGAHVVSVADAVVEVQGLLAMDPEARRAARHVVVGSGFSPGLSCLLARHAATHLQEVDEVRVARTGTGGPACALGLRRAMSEPALDRRDGAWLRRRAGSGRELCWFPDPVGGLDCYRAGLPEPLLLSSSFPDASRLSVRVGSPRWQRVARRLPRLGSPRPEGTMGAVRVEVRGSRGQAKDAVVLGVIDRPAVAAGTVAAVAAVWAATGRLAHGGAAGLAELVPDPVPFLRELAERGVRAAAFDPGAEGRRDPTDRVSV
ncbi:MAG: hypothetical protein ACRD0J_02595, partial [Acidimicrobiales bacterium]